MVGLLLSATSPAGSLALIPGRAARVSLEGCRLVVVILPPDPAAAKARVLSLIQEGFVRFICCPTVYAIVAGGEEVAELPVVELLREEPVVAAPEPVVQVVVHEPPVMAPEMVPIEEIPVTPVIVAPSGR
ncbi:MAG: hypothetical protein WCL49_10600 [bacterium]